MLTKNEKLKNDNIDKIALFLNKKYNKVFKDKQFTIDILKKEISKLLIRKKLFAQKKILILMWKDFYSVKTWKN